MRKLPPFAHNWRKRLSRSKRLANTYVWYDPDDDQFEYWMDLRPGRLTWHQIDWRQNVYRDLDPETGKPVAGREGQWRDLL